MLLLSLLLFLFSLLHLLLCVKLSESNGQSEEQLFRESRHPVHRLPSLFSFSLWEALDERVRRACEKTRELKIPDVKTLHVLRKLLRENGDNWNLIKLDNYTALIDAIYSLEEENEISSNNNRGKNPVVGADTLRRVKRNEKQSEGSFEGRML
ncbi:histone-lysine N-methyltransferase SUVR4-like [Raphanus sativus]|uniref:Histone-lysine N-methyltransferase SUVR4-like n=1 Tax=Raphanus sativus TaxID=3726 RepID=A0A9W3C3Q7_RAPSA|nr:histone-lysine N-methyltransferase SUVR4-like [Raphanus sativus]